MPIDRLARARTTLPEGYQFGDGRFGDGCRDVLIAVPSGVIAWLDQAGRAGRINVQDVKLYLHRADTAEPPGYGHAV